MASQIDTAQRRAEALVEQILTFVEQASGKKIRFKTIVDMSTGAQSDPTERLVTAMIKHDAETRRAALAEAIKVIPTNWCDPLLQGIKKSPCPEIESLLDGIRRALDRLREGVKG